MKRYLVLLRGINVGGKNRLPMKALKKCLESLIARSPFYKALTIRNWNTTTKLLALMRQ